MRAMWSGAVSFGLVNIPIRLYSATEEHKLNFHMLHKADMSPISYLKVCKEEGKEVENSDIVKGYEYERGRYVVITDEDFERASPRKTKTIDIMDFVAAVEKSTPSTSRSRTTWSLTRAQTRRIRFCGARWLSHRRWESPSM